MAINYSVVGMRNPSLLGEGEMKYYAKAQASGAVGIDQLAEEIPYATTLTDGDVVNAIRALTPLQHGAFIEYLGEPGA